MAAGALAAGAGVPAALSLDSRSWSAGDDAPLTPCLRAETALGLGLGVAFAFGGLNAVLALRRMLAEPVPGQMAEGTAR